ncbi:MAG: hypothetical protein COS42_05055 [Flavobacteriales bacterium CG03_land_8_20_14_0_80_35_15]|nr:MAG: hypothetical protein AUJ53_02555 [Flavobacteriaceae bacterium CG1_02_35_72]PIV17378.1 MAG: hypothetical protein COS42_05055 [Flavobacteriales bacterium CG03_land_8_20_14_0_80_35_15]PJA04744.1 MAG: hypothetical protein COX71_10295 [Flavobacteriales bacterium CG_4_10_14_0_2_um_filter_35_18]
MTEYKFIKTYNSNDLFRSFYKTLGRLFIFIIIGLSVDSVLVTSKFTQGQWIANGAMILIFLRVFNNATKRSKELMIYAVLIAIVGENLLSIGLEMYTYRLKSVPIYVFFGHAIIYIVAIYFTRKPAVKKYRSILEKALIVFIAIYATAFLIFAHDVFGFVLSILTVWILSYRPRERLFYLTMYLVVVVLEIIGTSYKCWYWPDTAFGLGSFLKSANPPSGISFFYFSLDLGCLWLYKQRHLLAWKRMKQLRIIQK